jgi:PAS domain S-box-containing protein
MEVAIVTSLDVCRDLQEEMVPVGAMIANSRMAAILCNPRLPDNPVVACNPAFVELTGYAEQDVLGRNCRFLCGPETEPDLTEQLRQGIAHRTPVMVEILNYRKDGTMFRNGVMIAPIFDAAGEIEFFLGSQVCLALDEPDAMQARRVSARHRLADLPRRQKEILDGVVAGKLNKQIAWELQISERTVKLHRAALLKTLGVQTNAEAIRLAIEAELAATIGCQP